MSKRPAKGFAKRFSTNNAHFYVKETVASFKKSCSSEAFDFKLLGALRVSDKVCFDILSRHRLKTDKVRKHRVMRLLLRSHKSGVTLLEATV